MASKRKTNQRRPASARRNRQAAQRQAQQRRTVIGVVLAALAVLAVVVAVVLTRGGDDTPAVAKVTPKQAYELMNTHRSDPTWVTLDVRTQDEFAAEHLADATNVDFYASNFRTQVGALDHSRTYIVYCHTGNRSGKATSIMHDLGFAHVYDVTGGIAAWQKAGLPTTA